MTPNDFHNLFQKLEIPMHGVRLPEFKVEGMTDGSKEQNKKFLRELALKGFAELIEKEKIEYNSPDYIKYKERLDYELSTFDELGFNDYILLVWDVINYCKNNGIPTGSSRGSAGGSLVLYFIHVTNINPIKHGLFFERFISKTRAKKQVIDGITYLDGNLMCDIDFDVCYYQRHRLLEHLNKKFNGKTAKILNLSKLTGKIVVKDCGKIFARKEESEMNHVTPLIPSKYGKIEDLKVAYDEVPEFKKWVLEDDYNKEAFKIALKLEGLIRSKSVHASGILISHGDITDSCPLEYSKDKETVSGFNMEWTSLLHVKLDALGLKTVSVIDEACKIANINRDDIDINNVFIYQQLQELKYPYGLFQISEPTAFNVCQSVKPRDIEHLSAVLALARPSSLEFVKPYSKFVETGEYESLHPLLDDILKDTGNCVLYQEQIMKILNKIGFSLEDSETARKIVGKKLKSEMPAWQEKIRNKIKENNLDEKLNDIIWGIMEAAANYSFVKAHATAYAYITAITIYLKFKHPQAFFLALLRMTKNEAKQIDEISKIEQELKQLNIKLYPPDLIKSENDFSLADDGIRFGLSSVKGVSAKSLEKLENFRNRYENKFEAFDAACEAGLSLSTLCPLIQAGALQCFGDSRTKMVVEMQLWKLLTQKERLICNRFGPQFNYDLPAIIRHIKTEKDEKGNPFIKPTRVNTLKKRYEPYLTIYELNKKNEDFANWWYENKLIGYSTGHTLYDIFHNKTNNLIKLSELDDAEENLKGKQVIKFVGIVTKVIHAKSKNGNKYIKFIIKDESKEIKCYFMVKNDDDKEKLDHCKKMNQGKLPAEDNIVICQGGLSSDKQTVFVDYIAVQDYRIFLKLNDLAKFEKSTKTKKIT